MANLETVSVLWMAERHCGVRSGQGALRLLEKRSGLPAILAVGVEPEVGFEILRETRQIVPPHVDPGEKNVWFRETFAAGCGLAGALLGFFEAV